MLAEVRRYTKLFWINSGPHNNLTARKFVLKCTPADVSARPRARADRAARRFRAGDGETIDELLERLEDAFFDPAVDPMVTCKTPGAGRDILEASANNLYERRDDGRSRGLRRSGTASTRGWSSATARWSKRSTASAAATATQIARSSAISSDALPYATPRRCGARSRR